MDSLFSGNACARKVSNIAHGERCVKDQPNGPAQRTLPGIIVDIADQAFRPLERFGLPGLVAGHLPVVGQEIRI